MTLTEYSYAEAQNLYNGTFTPEYLFETDITQKGQGTLYRRLGLDCLVSA
jgi:hypothetical protein